MPLTATECKKILKEEFNSPTGYTTWKLPRLRREVRKRRKARDGAAGPAGRASPPRAGRAPRGRGAAGPAGRKEGDCTSKLVGNYKYGRVRGGTQVEEDGNYEIVTFTRRDGTTAKVRRSKVIRLNKKRALVKINRSNMPEALKANARAVVNCDKTIPRRRNTKTCKAGYETIGKYGVKCYIKCRPGYMRNMLDKECFKLTNKKTTQRALMRAANKIYKERYGMKPGKKKPCKKGQVRNPKTGRCRKAAKAKRAGRAMKARVVK